MNDTVQTLAAHGRDLLLNGTGLAVAGWFAARLAIGTFFAISGYHKVTNTGGRGDTVLALFRHIGLPWPRFFRWFVPATELGAGVALTLGLATVPAALALLAICFVACCTDGLERVRSYPTLNRADWLDTLLYLPEVHIGLILLLLVASGPDTWAIDHLFR